MAASASNVRRTSALTVATLAAMLLLASSTGSAGTGILTGPAEVIDGDTIAVGEVTVRLNGIDAPELGQECDLAGGGHWQCADAAAGRLAELIGTSAVGCRTHGSDPYGRIIATCSVEEVDLGQRLVEDGLAWAFVRYDPVYREQEAAARAARVGLWQGNPEAPWDYRANRWERAAEEAPRVGCPIKGNINSEGERIYHTPWSPWYRRTKIDEADGERWFCDEAEAVAAGWRAARFR